ncbi:MAG: porin family protein [Crocinitomicaceae bacterium]|nr:porin family protein [Crocinitomicaceae bacterium]
MKRIRCGHMKFLTLLLVVISYKSLAQPEKPKNYHRYDEKMFHFGFMLGGNVSDFTLFQKQDIYEQYGITSIENQSQPGGQVGPVVTMNLGTPIVRLRLIPTLSFQERFINYQFEDSTVTGSFNNQEQVSSTSLDFPLMLQFRTNRLNNFAAYGLVGFQYSLDLQSSAEASQSFTDPFIKIKKSDYQGQIGGGIEFFATYFKFGIELKYSHGIFGSFIQDNTVVSRPIDNLYNRTWWISLIFEG